MILDFIIFFLTVMCEDALRSHHFTADMADNETKILQSREVGADKHLWNRQRKEKLCLHY